MNAARRSRLRAVMTMIEEACSELETIAGEEREAFENMPESLQGTERGERSSEIADQLDEAVSQLEDAARACDEAQY